jgi:hypothetical protein
VTGACKASGYDSVVNNKHLRYNHQYDESFYVVSKVIVPGSSWW